MKHDRKSGKIQLLLVVIFIAGSFAASKFLNSTYEPPSKRHVETRVLVVETSKVEPKAHHLSFKATGVVEARNKIVIVPQVSGRVVSVHDAFTQGGSFSKGDVLFQIEKRDYELAVQQLEAEVAQAKTALSLERAEVEAAKNEWNLVNKKKSVPDLVARKPQMDEAIANLKAAEASLGNALLDVERTSFTFPFDGAVLDSEIAVGQYITAGQSYGNVFDAQSLEVETSLEDKQLKWLLAAKEPVIKIRAEFLGEKKTFDGVLKQGASFLDTETRFATVRFGFAHKDHNLLPGVFANLSVQGALIDQVMLLPDSAIQTDSIVWVERKGAIYKWIPKVIYTSNHIVAVHGLKEPVQIVTSRVSGGIDGMQVKVVKNKAEVK